MILPFVSRKKYDEILLKLECLLSYATGGRYSKATYTIADMERVVDDYLQDKIDEELASQHEQKGEWIEENGTQICPFCGEEHEWENYRAPFCDQCGADLRGDNND